MKTSDKFIAFLLLSAGACLAMAVGRFMPFLSPLIIAIIFGAILSNLSMRIRDFTHSSGVNAIASKQILRFGVVLYGFSLSLSDIAEVGFSGVGFAFCVVFCVFFTGLYLGQKMGLSKAMSALIACGSAICGAAAVLALASVIKSDSQKVAVAIATVVVYGTLFMFVDVALFSLWDLGLSEGRVGYLLGASLHEVANVVAAGSALGESVGRGAVVMKMLRVLMLVPFLFMASFMFMSSDAKRNVLGAVPYFAIGFLVMVILGSMPFFPKQLLPYIKLFDTFLLCVAMFAIGFSLRLNLFKQAGIKPFLLGFVLSVWVFIFSYFLINIL